MIPIHRTSLELLPIADGIVRARGLPVHSILRDGAIVVTGRRPGEGAHSLNSAMRAGLPGQLGFEPSPVVLLSILVLCVSALVAIVFVLNVYERRRATESDSRASDRTPSDLTDEELVCWLVATNGGRMRQVEIVDSVDWSKAKVSRLLSDLEADGTVTKIRLGRENLIRLNGREIGSIGTSNSQPSDET